MPTYEYRCPACGHVTEDFVKLMSQRKETIPCEKCKTMSKSIIGNPRPVFFGEGFDTPSSFNSSGAVKMNKQKYGNNKR